MNKYLRSTQIINCDDETIQEQAQILTRGENSVVGRTVALFYFARDEIRYNPYASLYPMEASSTLKRQYGFCIQKAALLVALVRAVGIPARLGFVNIRNHRLPDALIKMLGNNIIYFHGFAEFCINGKWLKATPAFDLNMCQENGIIPVEFDGRNHGVFHSHDVEGNPHIDYLDPMGSYDDVPMDEILEAATRAWGVEYIECWETGNWDY